MPTVTANCRPGSRFRLLTLLTIAHASLAFYLWFCAFDVNLDLISVRLWVFVSWLGFVWPVLLAVRAAGFVNGQSHRGSAVANAA